MREEAEVAYREEAEVAYTVIAVNMPVWEVEVASLFGTRLISSSYLWGWGWDLG